jgi:hypothetical protein
MPRLEMKVPFPLGHCVEQWLPSDGAQPPVKLRACPPPLFGSAT